MAELKLVQISDPNQIIDIVPVIKSAWGMKSIEPLIKDIVTAMQFHGGLVLGAYEGKKMVGMHFSFPGYRKGKVYLYSHMTGVTQERKYSGIGFLLKQYQKRWALEHGFELIAWTFDPLMSLNAYFNIKKLGTVVRTYITNFYGAMEDALNFGVSTDRFVTEWWIKKDKLVQYNTVTFVNNVIIKENVPVCAEVFDSSEKYVGVIIPTDFITLKKRHKDIAIDWREKTRNIFTNLFKHNYLVIDFVHKSGESYYVLEKNSQYLSKDEFNIFI